MASAGVRNGTNNPVGTLSMSH